MKDIVELIAKALVDNPEAVKVEEELDSKGAIIRLRVAEADMGRVIGKQGRIAKAIRTVVKAAAMKTGQKVLVDIDSNPTA